MRFLFFSLTNYAGIFNGLGLHEITIDFSKCRNSVTLISGKNGSGKTTLLKALNPLPDGLENIIDKLPAKKIIDILDNEGSAYHLEINYPVNSNGNRMGTRAFISKNGVELNTTGNVTSYKEILFSEFELDSNYMALTKLSGDDRGIADKSPADRKKFVASILNSIDVYTEMYKNFTKKSQILKSYINNISTKIKNIGDEESLYARLVNIDSQYKRLELEKKELEKQKTEMEAYIKLVDPDGKIQEKYSGIYDSIKKINGEISKLEGLQNTNLEKIKDQVQSENYSEELKRMNKLYSDLDKKIATDEANEINLTSTIESINKAIDIDLGKLENLKNGFEIDNLRKSVKIVEDAVKSSQEIINSSKMSTLAISRAEFDTIYATMFNIRQNIKSIYDKYSVEEISNACGLLLDGATGDVDNIISDLQNGLDEQYKILQSLEMSFIQITSKIDSVKVLDSRPNNCKIDTCPFIINALEYSKQDLEGESKTIEDSISTTKTTINEYNRKLNLFRYSSLVIDDLESLANQINNSRFLLDKIPESVCLTDEMELFTRMARCDLFSEIDALTKYVDIINATESMTNDSIKLKELYGELKLAEAKEEAINALEIAIQAKRDEIQDDKDKLEKLKSDIAFDRSLLNKYNLIISTLESIIENDIALSGLKSDKQKLVDEYHTIDDAIKKIKEYIDKMNKIDSDISNIIHDMVPLESDKEAINYAITNLQNYREEMQQYSEKYNIINTLKKYSSPTTGIQTLYMDMYMGKTLTMANQLLGMLFGGEYFLLPYVINENEFRIPFQGSGMTVDDISSGSTSQVCMIGMIMNLVLLSQASSKYNIVMLDEIDGGLDFSNRGLFINTLYQLISLLNINQLVMISHNIESDLSNVDLIRLKGYEEDSNDYRNVNVIYDYNA